MLVAEIIIGLGTLLAVLSAISCWYQYVVRQETHLGKRRITRTTTPVVFWSFAVANIVIHGAAFFFFGRFWVTTLLRLFHRI